MHRDTLYRGQEKMEWRTLIKRHWDTVETFKGLIHNLLNDEGNWHGALRILGQVLVHTMPDNEFNKS